MNEDKAREAFETHMKADWRGRESAAWRNPDGSYIYTESEWRAFQAALQWAASQQAAEGWSELVQKRAADLHHKAAMPWSDAEALALNEVGIDNRAIDELIGECGYAGLQSMLCSADELRQFTRSVLVHQPPPPATQGGADA